MRSKTILALAAVALLLCTALITLPALADDADLGFVSEGNSTWVVDYPTYLYGVSTPEGNYMIETRYPLGDADSSGTVDPLDAAVVLQYSAGLIPLTALDYQCANVDFSGMWEADFISPRDAHLILRYMGEFPYVTLFN